MLPGSAQLKKRIPAWGWMSKYHTSDFVSDFTAALVVTVLLIPQSLAYAMLAGLPPELGLYASILPLIVYALFGTSRTLSVGPVAVASLMTAAALAEVSAVVAPVTAAITLAWLSGGMLMLMGFLRLGFVVNFLSHSVISGFVTASAILIAVSQLKHILGVPTQGDSLPHLFSQLLAHSAHINSITLALGAAVLVFLWAARRYANKLLTRCGVPASAASMLAKTAPIAGVLLTIGLAYFLNLADYQVALVGQVPSGLPSPALVLPGWEVTKHLAMPALLIAIIGYVESVSVGKTLAARRGQKIDADQELVGLGAANIASAASGAFPVTGGFSRSIVNFEAGAVTQMAGIFAAFGIALASLFLTPILFYLPKATLAATIIVAVLTLVDFSIFKKTWQFSREDFWCVAITVLVTLVVGVEAGVSCGVVVSLILYVYRTSKPHLAEVGWLEGSEHFRNVKRYQVITDPRVLMLRLDENLFFANAGYLQDWITQSVYQRGQLAHVVIVASAINDIDYSGLETLEAINDSLKREGVMLHLAEVKGPVMDKLEKTHFLHALSGRVFLSQFIAFNTLRSSDA